MAHAELCTFLQQCDLFSGLSAAEHRAIAERFPWIRKVSQTGTILAHPGDEVGHFIGIGSGTLAAEMIDIGGSVVLIETFTVGSIAAGPLLFSSQPILPVQLRVLENAVTFSMERNAFLKLLTAYPGILQHFLRYSADKIAFLAEKLRLAQFSTLTEKIASWFIRQAHLQTTISRSPYTVNLPYSQEMLANLFGVTRPALSRCLGRMTRDGLLRRDARRKYLVDPEQLQRVLRD